MAPLIVCIGNPLLDITVGPAEGPAYLQKYALNPNDAILAEDKHMPIYDDIVTHANVSYVAGGAAQNAARAASVRPRIQATADFTANEAEGVLSAYQIQPPPSKTGACAVILSNHDRSLCTTLRAAEEFTPSHLAHPDVANIIDGANYFYIEGYFLTHGIESALEIAKNASSKGKVVLLNLSAPFIPQFFKVQLEELLPHVDILIGNESEAAAYATATGMADALLSDVASALAALPKSNTSRPRLIVITQGADSTLVASSSPSTSAGNVKPSDPNPKTYPVPKLSDDQIVDTNGAGDMFAGGFLGTLAQGKDLDKAIEVGHKLGQMCVGQNGPKLVYPRVNV
ncbi:hypothetical protein I312_105903 [Cryptococcus bacillisporus CA1280]|uniref:uncharacterized protein n=1 Tax=Cryptococcus bacillisporus CA1280 TaxID=1296109 RepID=UPI003367A07E